jgi:hypothetical protein
MMRLATTKLRILITCFFEELTYYFEIITSNFTFKKNLYLLLFLRLRSVASGMN